MCLKLWLLIWLVIGADISRADISGLGEPEIGTCLCLDGDGVNVRDAECGNVIGSSSTGECYTYKGQKVGCMLSGTFYQYFEVDYSDVSGWIAGDFLIIGSDTQCVPEPNEEFRSLFVATLYNVDWPTSSSDPVSSQQQQLVDYLNMMDSTNMNAVVFQVRPCGDAMYNSAIEPWSKYLTGTQGQSPSPLWDPLTFLVTEAHNRGIEVHAWLNPYRANMQANWDGLTANHMANVYPEYAYPYDSYLWMDPGAEVIVDHLVSVIEDIINRYDIDGIHFDDYFYPYPDGTEFPDDSTYDDYVTSGGQLSRDDWRRDNVNRMMQRVYGVVSSLRPGVVLSVSPFGIYRPGHPDGMPSPISGLDPYSTLYADAKLWLQSGWVDFLAPQLYWEIDPPAQSYPTLLDWWLDANTLSRHVYAANAVYKTANANDWPVSEIDSQIALSRDSVRRSKQSLGNVMYSAKYFRDNTKGITDAFSANVYTNPATIPPMPWLGLRLPNAPTNLRVDNSKKLSWSPAGGDDGLVRWWLVMRRSVGQSEWSTYAILPADMMSLHVDPAAYAIRAVNAARQISQPAVISVV